MGTGDLTTRSSSIHDTSVDEVVSLDASSQPTSLQDLDNISIATSSSSGYGSPRVNRSMNSKCIVLSQSECDRIMFVNVKQNLYP